MLKKLVLLSSLLVTSMTAHAALIQYGDYTRDSTSNVVTGGGLEWLKWDVTKGMSINSALATYGSQGYRLASNNDVATMFNRFEFGKTDWQASDVLAQWGSMVWSSSEDSPYQAFLQLFGVTNTDSCAQQGRATYCYSNTNPLISATAFFGSDADNNHTRLQLAQVIDDYTYVDPRDGDASGAHYAYLSPVPWYTRTSSSESIGVALVRNSVPVTNAVSTPGSIGLLALGLVALGYRRRQALGR